ncbi:enoyl-CoA hydratase-related protein [Desulfocurvus sp. DL9XJH121]
MSQFENLIYECADGIATISINRPKALNALNADLLKELDGLVDDIAADENVQVVIVTGAGEKAFVAGADIAYMQNMQAIDGRAWGMFAQNIFNKIEGLPQVVIAAVNGYALGGGNELAMACDIRIASEKAKFGQPEVTLGITAGFGGTQRLPRLVGKGRAKQILFTGDMIDAAKAKEIGLVNEVTVPEALMPTAVEMAKKIMSRSPVAVRLTKSAVNRGLDVDLATGVQYEAEVFGLCFATVDQKEGMTAFLEKRQADFSGK